MSIHTNAEILAHALPDHGWMDHTTSERGIRESNKRYRERISEAARGLEIERIQWEHAVTRSEAVRILNGTIETEEVA